MSMKVVTLYENTQILEEYPIFIEFKHESAIDFKGGLWEMYTAFLRKTYQDV